MPDELIVTKKAELGEIMRDALAQPETTALAGGQVGLLNEDLAPSRRYPGVRTLTQAHALRSDNRAIAPDWVWPIGTADSKRLEFGCYDTARGTASANPTAVKMASSRMRF
jgi:hypothetical protein